MAEQKEVKFDLKVVHDNFVTSLHEEDDVHLKYYLESYDELNKFFHLMGSIFGFVSDELQSKVAILQSHLNSENSTHFATVKTMIEYEKSNNLLKKSNYVSGSRTLLRLHRGLDFIRMFLKRIGELQDEENTSAVCSETYDETLAKYHSFFIRTGAKIAMYALPNRGELFKRVCGDDSEDIKQALQLLPGMLEVTSTVYDRIDNLYTEHNLHSLP